MGTWEGVVLELLNSWSWYLFIQTSPTATNFILFTGGSTDLYRLSVWPLVVLLMWLCRRQYFRFCFDLKITFWWFCLARVKLHAGAQNISVKCSSILHLGGNTKVIEDLFHKVFHRLFFLFSDFSWNKYFSDLDNWLQWFLLQNSPQECALKVSITIKLLLVTD